MKPVKLVIIMILAAISAHAGQPAQTLIRAEADHRPIPVLSILYPDMTTADAYGIQTAYVRERLGAQAPAGFKAGLTAKAAQQRFGLTAPAGGVLFPNGRLATGAVISSQDFIRPMLETEIGFIMGRALTRPVSDTQALKQAVEAVTGVIEIPDLGFAAMDRLRGVDVIAANVAARCFIAGEPVPAGTLDLDRITVSLALDGQVVNQGTGADAMGSQWEALKWLVNTMIAQGWTIEPGQILITGALGKMTQGTPGTYMADFGPMGKLFFKIQ